jgi:hypothetical protein
MELLLLLGLGAFLLSRTQITTNTSAAAATAAAAAAASASGVPQVEISRIRLPHIIVNGKEVIVTSVNVPGSAFYKFVECKQPGGLDRILDIQNKLTQYENLKTDYIQRGQPRRAKFVAPLNQAATAYQNALSAHLQNCTNYQKQL